MTANRKYYRNLALSVVLAGGLAGFSTVAQASDYSQSMVRDAQQQLEGSGYYTGAVDGIYGGLTRVAIRRFQSDNNLTVTGRLDQATIDKLGLRSHGEANREADREDTGNTLAPSTEAVGAAQRQLLEKGFYKGDVDGYLGVETRAAIREYQRNSNLNVNGRLDQGTLRSLGVSK